MEKNEASLVLTLVLLFALVFTSLGNENLTNTTIDNLTGQNYTIAPEITAGMPPGLAGTPVENDSWADNETTMPSDANETNTEPDEVISGELEPQLNETLEEDNMPELIQPISDATLELTDDKTKQDLNLAVQGKDSGGVGILSIYVPVINSVETVPPNVWHNFYHNTSFVIKVNATDADQNLVAVKFTVTAPNGSIAIYNENASSYSSDVFNSATINASQYGYWNYTVYAIDADGVYSIYSGMVNVLNITISLNKTIADLGEVINVRGHINGGAGDQRNLSLSISINNISIVPYISNESLIGHWRFDDSLGTTVEDSSGNSNNGYCIRCPLASDGKFNTSFRFNDSTSVEFNKINSLNSLQNFSITLYAYVTGNSSYAEVGTYNQILAHKETFDLGITPQGNIYFNIQNESLINNWAEYSSNPVLTAGANNLWDDTNVSAPSIIKAENGTYQMWYTGRDDLANEFRIGYATSADGKSWTKYPTYVLNKSTGTGFDSDGVMWPTVIKQNSTYMMWYTGYDVSATDDYKIGFAVSKDGINWSRESTYVLNTGSTWEADSVMYPSVIYENNTYMMWYAGRNVTSHRYKLGYATSPNGITWTKSAGNPILSNGVSQSWEDTSVIAPHVIKDGDTYEMWYIGTNNTYYNIGYAYSYDGINWAKATDNPVFNGTTGDWDSRIGRVSVIKDANKYKMWYTGTNSRDQIGYAESTVGIASNPVFTPNEWSSIIATKDGNSIKLYKDGVMMASGASQLNTFAANSNLTLGKYFNGSIDDVRIYGRALSQFEISNLALKTNATGDYSLFIQPPFEAGSYEVKINATTAAEYGEANFTLLVDDVSDINSFYLVPTNPYYTGEYGSTFYIAANVTDGDDSHPLNVNFTIYSSNGSIVINNAGAVSRTGDFYQSEAYTLDNFGEWNYTIVTFDDSGGNDTAIGYIRFLQITQNLNRTIVDVGDGVRITGHVYDSRWNNVVNNSIFLYLNGIALNVTDGWNFNNPLLWWNTSYRFRMKFQADNMANMKLNNSLIYVNVSTSGLISQGWMNNDCGDVRFADFSGNKISHTVVESTCNSAHTLFWVWLNMSATFNTSFYMYYGNEGADLDINFTNPDRSTLMILHFDNSSVYGENDTFVNDYSTLAHNGIVNLATLSTDCPSGKCFDFDADGEYVKVADSQKLKFGNGSRDSPFSVTSWVKMRNYGNFTVLFKAADVLNAEYGLYTNKTGNLIFSLHDNYATDFFYEVSNSSLSSYADEWIFIAATYTGTPAKNSIKLYLNGEQLASVNQTNRTYTAMHNDANPLFIGYNPLTEKSSDGIIDEMKIYNKTLGQEEIRAFYNMTRITFMLNDSMLKTDKNGNFNYSFMIPVLGNGGYEFKVNSTYNGEYGEDNQTITITDNGNLAPAILSTNISSELPNKFTDLTCNVTAYDAENTTFTVEWIWYNLSNPVTGGNSTVTNYSNSAIATLDNSYTEIGENWNCTVRAYDGHKNSSYSSKTVTIVNEIPLVAGVAILPIYPNGTSDLECFATIKDMENASTLVYFQWYNMTEYGEIEIASGSLSVANNTNTLVSTLGKGNISGHETWKCNVTSFDGMDYSSKGYATTYVNNLAAMDEPMLYPLNANLSSSLVCNVTDLTESDGDLVYNLTAWYKNGESLYALYMPFEANGNDTNLTTLDYSGNDLSGTVYGANWTSNGKVGGAYKFDGEESYISISHSSGLITGGSQLTVETWINPDEGDWMSIVRKHIPASGSTGFSLIIGEDDQIRFVINDRGWNATSWNGSGGYTLPSRNTWYHVVGTYDGIIRRIYVDGILRDSEVQTGLVEENNDNLTIGQRGDSNEYFNGTVDEVKILNYTLSQEQIYQEYQDGISGINSMSIVSNELHLGNEWYCKVTPNDGYADGSVKISNNITILSTKPTMNLPNVTPRYPNATSNLTCNWINLTSVSGFPVVNITTWYRDYSPLNVLYMPFEGNDNYENLEAKDYSGYGNNGAVYGATWNRTGGRVGGAYEFDGVDDLINISQNNLFDLTDDLTISTWIKSGMFSTHGQGDIISRWGWWTFAIGQSPGNIRFFDTNGSGANLTEIFSGNVWHNVVATKSGQSVNTIKIFVDGVQKSSTEIGIWSNYANDSPIYIGGNPIGNGYFNGTIDEVKIYGYALSSEQIWSDYQAGLMNTTTSVIVSNETIGGGDFYCSAVPNDGWEDGITYDSALAHVAATPDITNVIIMQTSGTAIANIHCNVTITDSDNSSLYVNYSWYNITGGSNDLFSTGMTTVSTGWNARAATLSSAYLGRNDMWNCSVFAYDGVLYSTEKSDTIIIDVDLPQITINHPANNFVIPDNHYTLNYTVRETNIDSLWYTIDDNTIKIGISGSNGTNTNAIIFSYPGKHNLTLHVNDTLGSEASSSAIIYLNYSFSPNAWAALLKANIPNATSVSVLNFTSNLMFPANTTVNQNFTIQINFSNSTMEIIGMPGLESTWSFFTASDNSTTFVTDIINNHGALPIDYIVVWNFTRYFSNASKYYAKVRMAHNSSYYTGIYYCSDDSVTCNKISQCTATYLISTAEPCYSTNNYVLVPHLSSVYAINDSIPPTITISSPANNSVSGDSYNILLSAATNENATCKYSFNDLAYTNLSGSKSFSATLSYYVNSRNNITMNCTDLFGNSRLSRIYFNISDTTEPDSSLSYSIGTDYIRVTIRVDEPSNATAVIIGNASRTNTSYGLSHVLEFTGLTAGTTYQLSYTFCDHIGNCESKSAQKTTDSLSTSSGGTTGGSGSGGGTTGGTTATYKFSEIWQGLTEGEHTMNIANAKIAFTKLIFILIRDISGAVQLSAESRDLPGSIPPLEGMVYQYLEVQKATMADADIAGVTIRFRVENTWINNYNIDTDQIYLYRFNNEEWWKLTTTKTSQDSGYTYYEASSPGFSYFAIVGFEKQEESPPEIVIENPPTGEIVNPPIGSPPEELPPDSGSKQSGIGGILFMFIILAVVLSAVGAFMLYQKNETEKQQKETAKQEMSEIKEYIATCKLQGLDDNLIRSTLLNSGWSQQQIEQAFMSMFSKPLSQLKPAQISQPSQMQPSQLSQTAQLSFGKPVIVQTIPEMDSDISDIRDYIKTTRQQGFTDDQIKAALSQVGWEEDQIKNGFM